MAKTCKNHLGLGVDVYRKGISKGFALIRELSVCRQCCINKHLELVQSQAVGPVLLIRYCLL